MVFQYAQVAVHVSAHGASGLLDELGCFVGLFVVALAVVLVYGRDLLKPEATDKQKDDQAAKEEKQGT